jgi:hypothetical protein
MFGLIFATALTIVVVYIVFTFVAFFLTIGLLAVGAIGFAQYHEPLFLIPLVLGMCLSSVFTQ